MFKLKSILVGNGINIQFGGMAYTSKFIMKRIKFKAKMDGYKQLFNQTLSKEDILNILNGFVGLSNEIIRGELDSYIRSDDEEDALFDYKKRYSEISEPHEIMLEDWFFILHMFLLKNADLAEEVVSAKQGFERMILDAIYNDGDIQNIHQKMNKKTKRFFKEFDNIFTLNYDNNLEKLTGKKVFHLHGDYSVAHSDESCEYVNGYIRKMKAELVTIKGLEHCFCNALLDYSGDLKLKKADINHKINLDSESYRSRYENDDKWKHDLDAIRNTKPFEYELIMTKIENPNLTMKTEYHFDKLKNIEGELHIIGMSPNNDSHIFNLINHNRKISKVVYYYFSEDDRKLIEDNFPENLYKPESIKTLWRKLDAVTPSYNNKYQFPEKIDDFIKLATKISEDYVTKDEIIDEVNRIPKFEMMRLSKMVKEELNRRNPDNQSTGEKEFRETNASISYIALKEGLLPAALYIICIMNW